MRPKIIVIVSALVLIASMLFYLVRKRPGMPHKDAASTIVFANDSFKVRPLTDIHYERTTERLQRGQYLAEGLLQCFTCHSPRDWQLPGAPIIAEKKGGGGTILLEDSVRRIIAPNISPDKESGGGNWTDDMYARAIREGVGHDGRALYWQMPYSTFRNLSDEDLAAVVVYVKSIPPVHNVVPPTILPAAERIEMQMNMQPIIKPIPVPDLTDSMKRGRYLVKLGECMGCHTSHSEYNPGINGGGNHIHRFGGEVFSANITIDPSGIPYGANNFMFVIRTGKGGTLSPVMPWISFKNMTDDDLKTIYYYLSKLPPAHHYVTNQKPFTHCAICGMEHGLGDHNKREMPAGIKMDRTLFARYAGTYRNDKQNWSMKVVSEAGVLKLIPWDNAPKTELVPQSDIHFLAPGYFFPIDFVKDEKGKIFQLVEGYDEGNVFTRVD